MRAATPGYSGSSILNFKIQIQEDNEIEEVEINICSYHSVNKSMNIFKY